TAAMSVTLRMTCRLVRRRPPCSGISTIYRGFSGLGFPKQFGVTRYESASASDVSKFPKSLPKSRRDTKSKTPPTAGFCFLGCSPFRSCNYVGYVPWGTTCTFRLFDTAQERPWHEWSGQAPQSPSELSILSSTLIDHGFDRLSLKTPF